MATVPVALSRPLAYRPSRRAWGLGLLVGVVVGYLLLHDQYLLPHDQASPAFRTLNDAREWVDANRQSNPILVFLIDIVRGFVAGLVDFATYLLVSLTWLGVTAIGTCLGWLFGGWRLAALMFGGLLSFGVLGLWPEAIDTLALTLAAVVLSLLIGLPLGIWAGRSDRLYRLITPALDVMQIMPTFAYLAPLALFFLIGPASAAIATMIYAIPPAVRITALGVRGVSEPTVEAAISMGSTRLQTLRLVQLPMSRKQIVLAVNQTMMMALAMVVITALIDAPGLGGSIIFALERVDVGSAFDAGLAIVIMAILLDRLTTSASEHAEISHRSGRADSPTRRRIAIGATIVISIIAVALGNATEIGTEFPAAISFSFAGPVNGLTDWLTSNLYDLTDGFKNLITYGLINPLQGVLTTSPWWLVVVASAGIALLISGVRPAITAGTCLLAIAALGLWEHGMQTLSTVLVATFLTLIVGIVLGIAAARSDRWSRAMRPLLDAAQTMPSFVYLIPAVALFGATRFTAIVAAFIYAVPPVIRLVDQGIRGVPATVVEAAVAAGSDSRQLLWKVQLPMARHSLLLAANQGIVMVLAMVVVGGLVGAGALGYDVVAGFAQREDFGKGLAAGISIVLLGIILDRITQGVGRKQSEASTDEAT